MITLVKKNNYINEAAMSEAARETKKSYSCAILVRKTQKKGTHARSKLKWETVLRSYENYGNV